MEEGQNEGESKGFVISLSSGNSVVKINIKWQNIWVSDLVVIFYFSLLDNDPLPVSQSQIKITMDPKITNNHSIVTVSTPAQ